MMTEPFKCNMPGCDCRDDEETHEYLDTMRCAKPYNEYMRALQAFIDSMCRKHSGKAITNDECPACKMASL